MNQVSLRDAKELAKAIEEYEEQLRAGSATVRQYKREVETAFKNVTGYSMRDAIEIDPDD